MEIRKLVKEIDKLRIVQESLKKEVKQRQDESVNKQLSYDQYVAKMKADHELKLDEVQRALGDFDKRCQKLEKAIKTKDSKINEYQSVLSQKEQYWQNIIDQKDEEIQHILHQRENFIASKEKDSEKLADDLKQYKQRCKDYEQELEQLKGFDQSNMSAIGKSVTGNKYDYEIKQIKEVFNQQLNKAKEESNKYK